MDETKIVEAVKKEVDRIWKSVYHSPDSIDVRIGTYKGETAVFIRAEREYNAPALTFAQLLELSKFFKTTRIDCVDDFAYGGCETCDYGSSYGWELAILPPKKDQKEITLSTHGWMLVEDI